MVKEANDMFLGARVGGSRSGKVVGGERTGSEKNPSTRPELSSFRDKPSPLPSTAFFASDDKASKWFDLSS